MKVRAQDLDSILFAAVGIALITLTPLAKPPVSERNFLVPPADLKHFVLGYREIVADTIWLRLIQDIDRCEIYLDQRGQPMSSEKELGKGARCGDTDKGWAYHMLDAVTQLAPKFRAPYIHGAPTLSVLVHDREGARLLFDRGIENFPTDWSLLYYAGYHYMTMMGDVERAAELLVAAGKNGAPAWVYSLAARLYTKDGQVAFAKSVLEQMIEADPDGRFTPRLKEQLELLEQSLKK